MAVKLPKSQILWVTYFDAKGRPEKMITSDPGRIKYSLYKIEGDKPVKVKTGDSPAAFAEDVGKI